MPAPTVVSDFLECVRKSGVVEPQRLESTWRGSGATRRPRLSAWPTPSSATAC